MDAYAPEIERQMKRLFDSLAEKDRRWDRATPRSKHLAGIGLAPAGLGK